MTEETQEVPKWLKELEEKRERRLKARLGHEAGAGSPCLACEEKCPGLDLHFWRKICKNCKCGKENHDVNDDDMYGWAQFQLLGSKPSKARKIVLPGRKDAVELEWAPKGQSDVVESYLKDLPLDLLPIKGSAAAQERKQLLQKQIPLHDIDPTLCHALSETEVKKMNDYVAHVKQNSVGVGHIMKLNELLKNRHAAANTQVLASRAPMQLSQLQNIVLQGVDRANVLRSQGAEIHKNLRDLSLDEQKPFNVSQGEQIASEGRIIRDVRYDAYRNDDVKSDMNQQNSASFGRLPRGNLRNMQVPQQLIANQIDYQQSTTVAGMRDINYPINQAGSVQTPNSFYNQNSTIIGNAATKHTDRNPQIPNNPIYTQTDYQNATNFGTVHDIQYKDGPPPSHKQTREDVPVHQQGLSPQNLPHYVKSSLINIENTQNPVEYGQIRNVYPDMNVNFDPHLRLGELEMNPELLDNVSNLKSNPNMPHYVPGRFTTFVEQQNPQKFGNIKDLAYSTYDPNHTMDLNNKNVEGDPYAPAFHGTSALKELVPENNLHEGVGHKLDLTNENLKGDQYMSINKMQGTYDPKALGQGIKAPSVPTGRVGSEMYGYAPAAHGLPANYNPSELTVPEQSMNPTPITVGIITDLEYPTIKAAVQMQDEISGPTAPRKNLQFDLAQETLPLCHRCKKMFDATALVVGIDRTEALWHAECFKCSGCNQNLADLMYFYEHESDDIYCGRDYAKIRGIPRCQACDELIFVKEYCLAENSTFHVKHFCCFECDEPLAGQNYVMEDLQPLCLPCFEKVKAEQCNACLQVIKPDEQGANLNGVHFHANDDCFACKMCQKPLLGVKLLFKNRNLYCSAPCFSADK